MIHNIPNRICIEPTILFLLRDLSTIAKIFDMNQFVYYAYTAQIKPHNRGDETRETRQRFPVDTQTIG